MVKDPTNWRSHVLHAAPADDVVVQPIEHERPDVLAVLHVRVDVGRNEHVAGVSPEAHGPKVHARHVEDRLRRHLVRASQVGDGLERHLHVRGLALNKHLRGPSNGLAGVLVMHNVAAGVKCVLLVDVLAVGVENVRLGPRRPKPYVTLVVQRAKRPDLPLLHHVAVLALHCVAEEI